MSTRCSNASEIVISGRNVLASNMLNVMKKDTYLKTASVKRLTGWRI